MTRKKQKYKKLQKQVLKLQTALKKEIVTKNQYYEKVKKDEIEIKALKGFLKQREMEIEELTKPEEETVGLLRKNTRSNSEGNSRKNSEMTGRNRKISKVVDKYQYDHLKMEFDNLIAANKNLKKKVSLLEKQVTEQQKVGEIHKKQVNVYVDEMRKICALNIEMKPRLEELIQDNEEMSIDIKNLKVSNENLSNEKNDFYTQIQKILEEKGKDREYIEELQEKIVRPDDLAYIYNIQKQTVFGPEKIQLIMRKRMKGGFVLEIETQKQERFAIKFRNIKGIEKDVRDHGKLKIIQNSRLNREIILITENRSKLLSDLKKFWKMHKDQSAIGSIDVLSENGGTK